MATFVKIATVDVGAGGTSAITFSSIPQTYTDLKIIFSIRNNRGSAGPGYGTIKFNNSSANFSNRYVGQYNSGSGDSGGPVSGTATGGYFTYSYAIDAQTGNTFGAGDIYIPNYISTSYAKSFSVDSTNTTNATYPVWQDCQFVVWDDTSAITSIALSSESNTILQGSTVSLYGIKNS